MRKRIDYIILLLVLLVGIFALKNAHAIGDWVHSLTYNPPAEISKLAEKASLNSKGKLLFYRFSPSLLGQNDLDKHCGMEKLGCTENRSIYILNYSNNEEFNQSTVTAAHEMLHVAYSRLNSSQKDDMNKLLDAELEKSTSKDIKDKLSGYPVAEYYDEAHSFIGTEMPTISAGLSEYYNKYFDNRDKIIEAFENSP